MHWHMKTSTNLFFRFDSGGGEHYGKEQKLEMNYLIYFCFIKSYLNSHKFGDVPNQVNST